MESLRWRIVNVLRPISRDIRRYRTCILNDHNSKYINIFFSKYRHIRYAHCRNSLLVTEQRIQVFVAHRFHTTTRSHVSPFFWIFLKPAAKIGVILGGRCLRKNYQALPSAKRQRFWMKVKSRWPEMMFGAILLTGTGYLYYYSHLQEVPITKRLRFVAFTDEQFLKIAQHNANKVLKAHEEHLLSTDHPCWPLVMNVADRLIRSNQDIEPMRNQKWRIALVDKPDRVAFVQPTGEIFIYTGLLKFLMNEDQLAIIISHEMSHALLAHGAEKVSFAQLMDFMIIVVMAAMWIFLPNDGIALVTQWFYNKVVHLIMTLPYGRKLEKEADEVGLHLAAKACFDVREGKLLWDLMEMDSDFSGRKIPEWKSTHPSSSKRADHMEYLLPKAFATMKKCNCAPLPDNMRQTEKIKKLRLFVDNEVIGRKAHRNYQHVQVIKKQQELPNQKHIGHKLKA